MKALFLLTLTCGLLSTGTPLLGKSETLRNQLESQLANEYYDKVLALRHSFKSNSQEYSVDGTPAMSGEEGPWTVYGRMVVNKITLGSDQLKVEGKRAVFFFDKGGNLTQFQEDRKHPPEKLRIVLRLQHPLSSAEETASVLGRVFALTPEDIVNSAPAYWRQQLEGGLRPSRKDTGSENAIKAAEKGNEENERVYQLADLSDKKHFSAPQLLPHREPDFSDAARSRRFQGVVALNVVIDKTGKVRNIVIVHPLGMGLDDNAVATVGAWQFTPATRDGEPIAVSLHIEVGFHLY